MRDCEGSMVRDCWVVFGFFETEVFVVNPYFRSSCAALDTGFQSLVRSQGARYLDETTACGNCCTTSGLKPKADDLERWVLQGMEGYGI